MRGGTEDSVYQAPCPLHLQVTAGRPERRTPGKEQDSGRWSPVAPAPTPSSVTEVSPAGSGPRPLTSRHWQAACRGTEVQLWHQLGLGSGLSSTPSRSVVQGLLGNMALDQALPKFASPVRHRVGSLLQGEGGILCKPYSLSPAWLFLPSDWHPWACPSAA